MTTLQNLHMHSCYCDGANTIENTIKVGIEKGFDSIGFSGHSTMPHPNTYSMTLESEQEYIKEVQELKIKYADKIEVLLGIEYDFYSINDLSNYDFIIADVHHIKVKDTLVDMDVRKPETVQKIIDDYFDGDGLKYARAFYETTAKLVELERADFVGHFDLIEKHIEKANLFDHTCKKYKDYQICALETLVKKIPIFEINTGAIPRGYRSTPYPSISVLKELKRLGGNITISSDCHDNKYLSFKYDYAVELAKEAGFKEYYVFTKKGFKSVPFDKLLNKL